ncbi:MCE family protein [Alcaligenaceae bacterium SJ-26]|nr:MCE family protein [Alcaligenaceae bacterium SJ-26]
MTDSQERLTTPAEPTITRRPTRRVSLVWLVPVVAALIGLSMLVNTWLSKGPVITISFTTATGLEAGKTPVKYKDVTVGGVSAIALSDDGKEVLVTVNMIKTGLKLTREDTRFWVVRPRIGMSGVSGIDTLLSGAYIAVDLGQSEETARKFVGLENPPTVITGTPGRSFILHAQDLGSLDIGSPVYYRRIPVGRVAAYSLDESGRRVNVQIFVDAPYDKYVRTDTRFWNASGVDLTLGANGLNLQTESLASILAGGIAFHQPTLGNGEQAQEHSVFALSPDEATALAPPDGPGQYLELRFQQSLRGLAIGAPVLFSGVNLGKVISLSLDYDETTKRFPTVVGVMVYPQRLGPVLNKLTRLEGDTDAQMADFLATLVAHGLRAQANTGNLLTGQLYISLNFVPDATPVAFNPDADPLVLPTIDSGFGQMEEQISSIVAKINRIPFADIGRNLNASLANLDRTLAQINGQVLPDVAGTLDQAQRTLRSTGSMLSEDAPLQQNLNETLLGIQRATRSLQTLTDVLGRSPDALLRGLPAQQPPMPGSGRDHSREMLP